MKYIKYLFSNQQQEFIEKFFSEITGGLLLKSNVSKEILLEYLENSIEVSMRQQVKTEIDDRLFINVVDSFYSENKKSRPSITRFKKAVLRHFGSSIMSLETFFQQHEKGKREYLIAKELKLSEVREMYEKEGHTFLKKLGPEPKKAFLKFIEEN